MNQAQAIRASLNNPQDRVKLLSQFDESCQNAQFLRQLQGRTHLLTIPADHMNRKARRIFAKALRMHYTPPRPLKGGVNLTTALASGVGRSD